MHALSCTTDSLKTECLQRLIASRGMKTWEVTVNIYNTATAQHPEWQTPMLDLKQMQRSEEMP